MFFVASISPVGWVRGSDVGFSSTLACFCASFVFILFPMLCCCFVFFAASISPMGGLGFLALVFLLVFRVSLFCVGVVLL